MEDMIWIRLVEVDFSVCMCVLWLVKSWMACMLASMRKISLFFAMAMMVAMPPVAATTITVVPIFEPISLHATDGDDAISEIGEALQATVMSRPMALSGAFPEVLVESMRTPHPLPSNNPNYQVQEANLFVLCNVDVEAMMTEKELLVTFDISNIDIPVDVDLTTRQILRIGIVALRRTLAAYQAPQPDPLSVRVRIAGAVGDREPLRDAGVEFTLSGTPGD